LWAEVQNETGRGKDQTKARDPPGRYVREVQSAVDPGPAEEDVQSEAPEWKLRERREREEEGRQRQSWVSRTGAALLPSRTLLHDLCIRGVSRI